MKIAKFFALLCAAATFAVGCEENSTKTEVPAPDPNATLEIKVNAERITIGQEIKFTVLMDGVDVTAGEGLAIYDASNYDQVSNPFIPTEIRDYDFYAMYGPLVTEEHALVTVQPVMSDLPEDPQPESTKFNHRILLIDHTASGCTYCPNMMDALKELSKTVYHDRYNEVTAHYGGLAARDNAKSDAAAIVAGNIAASIPGFPSLTFNLRYPRNASANASVIKSHIDNLWNAEGAEAGIAAVTTVGDQKVIVDIEVKAAVEQEYRVAAWLLEDNIYSKQTGAKQEWHNYAMNAIRDITGYNGANDLSGDSLGVIKVGETAVKRLELDVLSTDWVIDNMKVLVIVTAASEDYNGKFEVVNTAVCPIRGAVEYEYLAE